MSFDYHPINLPPPRGVGAGLSFIADLKAKQALAYQQQAAAEQEASLQAGLGFLGNAQKNIYDIANDSRTAARQRERDADIYNRQTARDTTNYERESDDNLFKVTGGYRRADIQALADRGGMDFGTATRNLIGQREFKDQQDKIGLYREQHNIAAGLTEDRQLDVHIQDRISQVIDQNARGLIPDDEAQDAIFRLQSLRRGATAQPSPEQISEGQFQQALGMLGYAGQYSAEKLNPIGQRAYSKVAGEMMQVQNDPTLTPSMKVQAAQSIMPRLDMVMKNPTHQKPPPPTDEEQFKMTHFYDPSGNLYAKEKNGTKPVDVWTSKERADFMHKLMTAQVGADGTKIPGMEPVEAAEFADWFEEDRKAKNLGMPRPAPPSKKSDDATRPLAVPPMATPQDASRFLEFVLAGGQFQKEEKGLERAFDILTASGDKEIRTKFDARRREIQMGNMASQPRASGSPQAVQQDRAALQQELAQIAAKAKQGALADAEVARAEEINRILKGK